MCYIVYMVCPSPVVCYLCLCYAYYHVVQHGTLLEVWDITDFMFETIKLDILTAKHILYLRFKSKRALVTWYSYVKCLNFKLLTKYWHRRFSFKTEHGIPLDPITSSFGVYDHHNVAHIKIFQNRQRRSYHIDITSCTCK